ncbi:MAG: VacJ family lipoprotein [Burkholderiales bacterium]
MIRPLFQVARTAGAAAVLAVLLATGACAAPDADRAPPAGGADAGAFGAAGAVAANAANRDAEDEPDDGPRRANIDPLEPLNRGVWAFNDALDGTVIRPVARFYDRWTPEVVRMIARNFLSNLLDPYIALNNFLQGKPSEGFSDLARFLLNTTFGFIGFGDPASEAGYVKHREDFGQTLGVWGVPTGPYLVLPVFGPSNVRDGVGFGVDAVLAVFNRFDDVSFRNSLVALGFVETRAGLLSADRVLDDALDRYLLVRDGYLARRRYLVYDGNPPDKD